MGDGAIVGVQNRKERPFCEDPDRLMDVPELASMLHMSQAWIRQHANGLRQPTIPSIKLGKSVRFRRSSVLQFVAEMERCVK